MTCARHYRAKLLKSIDFVCRWFVRKHRDDTKENQVMLRGSCWTMRFWTICTPQPRFALELVKLLYPSNEYAGFVSEIPTNKFPMLPFFPKDMLKKFKQTGPLVGTISPETSRSSARWKVAPFVGIRFLLSILQAVNADQQFSRLAPDKPHQIPVKMFDRTLENG